MKNMNDTLCVTNFFKYFFINFSNKTNGQNAEHVYLEVVLHVMWSQ